MPAYRRDARIDSGYFTYFGAPRDNIWHNDVKCVRKSLFLFADVADLAVARAFSVKRVSSRRYLLVNKTAKATRNLRARSFVFSRRATAEIRPKREASGTFVSARDRPPFATTSPAFAKRDWRLKREKYRIKSLMRSCASMKQRIRSENGEKARGFYLFPACLSSRSFEHPSGALRCFALR